LIRRKRRCEPSPKPPAITTVMKAVKLFLAAILISFLVANQSTAQVSSNGTGGGDWDEVASWNSSVPGCIDTIVLLAGDKIDITSMQDYGGCATPVVILLQGNLKFSQNGSKLWLPYGSSLELLDGAEITPNGANNSNKIFIDGDAVWSSGQGPLTGPACLGCTALPIELTAFSGASNGKHIDLNWTTNSEINNDFFSVERSIDGEVFEIVGTVSGQGFSNEVVDYEFQDDFIIDTGNGLYYRLKQTDFNGDSEYSAVIHVEGKTDQEEGFSMYPNPWVNQNQFNIQLDNNETSAWMELRNMEGQIVFATEVNTNVGFSMNAGLAAGVYLVTVIGSQSTTSKRLIVR